MFVGLPQSFSRSSHELRWVVLFSKDFEKYAYIVDGFGSLKFYTCVTDALEVRPINFGLHGYMDPNSTSSNGILGSFRGFGSSCHSEPTKIKVSLSGSYIDSF